MISPSFVDIPGRNYKVLNTHVTYGLVKAIKMAAAQICPQKLSDLELFEKKAYLGKIGRLTRNDVDHLNTPVVSVSFEYFCGLAEIFSDVYSCWCDRNIIVRPLTINECIYCTYRNNSDCEKYNIDYPNLHLGHYGYTPDDFIVDKNDSIFDYTVWGNGGECKFSTTYKQPLVGQKKPNWCGLYDTFGHTWTQTYQTKQQVVDGSPKKNGSTLPRVLRHQINLIGGSCGSTGESYFTLYKVVGRSPRDVWDTVGTRFLLEEAE